MERLPEIKRIIASQLGVEESQIEAETNLIDDLGCDSLDIVKIAMEFEEQYDIEISDDEAEACKTVADIAALLDRLIPTES